MQTTQAASLPVTELSAYDALPYWLRLTIGFILIGLGASIAASQLRAAIPPSNDPTAKKLHHLYAPSFGLVFGLVAYPALPGIEVSWRWLVGLCAPFLWAPLYDLVRKRYETQLGVKLPEASELTKPPTKEGGS